ncbi:helix-turn-helix domain-containing protein [Thiomicrorhabdus cannonii]|uniref:helix-turn-helix domain-containing protein n=1 Tax=Thiomicrorhabdus cannonii TaxID=2748011 RepID=UPI0015BF1EBA|nr:helix-turn-helix transcriptional regulator [Thiomicrorhabdus cannonii]
MSTDYQNEAWFMALQQAVANESQAKVASKCGISPTAVNQVLKGTYQGNINNVAEKVSGALLEHSVICPVLDVITTDICASHRNKPFAPNNPMRVNLYRACQTCQHNPKGRMHERT